MLRSFDVGHSVIGEGSPFSRAASKKTEFFVFHSFGSVLGALGPFAQCGHSHVLGSSGASLLFDLYDIT